MEALILIQDVMLIRTEIKVKIVAIILGNLEGRETNNSREEGRELDMEEEEEMILTTLLEETMVTLEMETMRITEGEEVVPTEGEITADGLEISSQEMEVAVAANLHPGNNGRGMIS